MVSRGPGELAILTALMLTSCASAPTNIVRPSFGFSARIGKTRPCGNDDARLYVIEILQDGVLKLNNEVVTLTTLGQRLDEELRTRVYHFVFVLGDPGVPFSEVANVIDQAAPHVDQFVIVTPSIMKRLDQSRDVCLDDNLPAEYIAHPPR